MIHVISTIIILAGFQKLPVSESEPTTPIYTDDILIKISYFLYCDCLISFLEVFGRFILVLNKHLTPDMKSQYWFECSAMVKQFQE